MPWDKKKKKKKTENNWAIPKHMVRCSHRSSYAQDKIKSLIYIYIYTVYIRGGTVHVFVPNHHGTGISVRCMMPYDKYRQFPPNPEGGARNNATLFDNRQQKNSECQQWYRGGCADVWLTVFYFDEVPTVCQVSNAGTDVCECVCVQPVLPDWMDDFQPKSSQKPAQNFNSQNNVIWCKSRLIRAIFNSL